MTLRLPRPFRAPTPLERATAALVDAQHDLLGAKHQHEQWASAVSLYERRCARLRADISELSREPPGGPQ